MYDINKYKKVTKEELINGSLSNVISPNNQRPNVIKLKIRIDKETNTPVIESVSNSYVNISTEDNITDINYEKIDSEGEQYTSDIKIISLYHLKEDNVDFNMLYNDSEININDERSYINLIFSTHFKIISNNIEKYIDNNFELYLNPDKEFYIYIAYTYNKNIGSLVYVSEDDSLDIKNYNINLEDFNRFKGYGTFSSYYTPRSYKIKTINKEEENNVILGNPADSISRYFDINIENKDSKISYNRKKSSIIYKDDKETISLIEMNNKDLFDTNIWDCNLSNYISIKKLFNWKDEKRFIYANYIDTGINFTNMHIENDIKRVSIVTPFSHTVIAEEEDHNNLRVCNFINSLIIDRIFDYEKDEINISLIEKGSSINDSKMLLSSTIDKDGLIIPYNKIKAYFNNNQEAIDTITRWIINLNILGLPK